MEKNKPQEHENNLIRPPVVVVMGHIDHGKTMLLDWYRKTKVAGSEAGGITQHIGAYEISHEGKKATFIDTPGHEAFSKLRARGAQVADIAVIVIAADEGIRPQTREALRIAQEHHLPFVIALNKTDKHEANPERVRQELAQESIVLEQYGGDVPWVEVSAKTGAKMDELLEVIFLLAELKHLTAHPDKSAEGVVIEAQLDARRGIGATLLVRDGTIRRDNIVVVGKSVERARILEDFRGAGIDSAGASQPVRMTGMKEMPTAGDLFRVFPARADAERYSGQLSAEETMVGMKQQNGSPEKEQKPMFHIILKADTGGSQEALEESLAKLNCDMVGVHILKSEIGDISEGDVKLAAATKRITIIGFNVRASPVVRALAEQAHIRIIESRVIYEILDEAKKYIEEIILPITVRTELGRAKIIKIFRKDGARQIVGGRVEEGSIKKNARVEIVRMKEIMGIGAIAQLQKNKSDIEMVEKGSEYGALIDSRIPLMEGDALQAFNEEVVKRTLAQE